MNTVPRYDVHQFGHPVEMVMASAYDEQAVEIRRLKSQLTEIQLKISDLHLEAHADTVLLQRVIAENSALRSDIDILGNVLDSAINHAARYLDAHKAFRQRILELAEEYDDREDPSIALGNLRDAMVAEVKHNRP
jgi:ABC-type phosphate transport system auxiliary subunit